MATGQHQIRSERRVCLVMGSPRLPCGRRAKSSVEESGWSIRRKRWVSSVIERERTRLLDGHRDRHALRLWVSGPSNGRWRFRQTRQLEWVQDFQFSLGAQSPQLLSKEDTFPVGKGEGQQRWHSNATGIGVYCTGHKTHRDKLPTSHLLLMERQVFTITHIRMQVVWARQNHPT